MRMYEIACLLNQKIKKEEIENLKREIETFLFRKSDEFLQKITLAYPVKKEGSAFFYTITGIIEKDNLNKLSDFLKKQDNVLRFRIFKKEEKEIKRALKKQIIKKTRVKKVKKVEIEKIDEKLKEILKEK